MNILRTFNHQFVSLGVFVSLVFLSVAVSGTQVVDASPIPRVKVPIIWEEAGQAHATAWGVNSKEWSYVEFGDVRSVERQILRDDLRKTGWSGISIDDHIDHVDSLDDSLNRFLVDRMLFEWGFPRLGIRANQGLWQLVIYIMNEGDIEGLFYDGNIHPYVAIITHERDLKAEVSRLPVHGYQAVPGSELVDAYFYADGEGEIRLYQFKTTSSLEAVIAHHARMDWDIYPLGILGTFGYSEKDSLLLNVHPPRDDLEGTFYTIMYNTMAELGEIGEW